MSSPRPISEIRLQIDRIRALAPSGEDLQGFISNILDETIASSGERIPMGVVGLPIVPRQQMLASARITAQYIDSPETVASRPEGVVDLGVIEWLVRPALPLKDDVFDPVASGPWSHLAGNVVQRQASAVCRLDVIAPGTRPLQIGTGFLAGEDSRERLLVLTNSHVVEEALRLGWSGGQGVSFGCDFHRFSSSLEPLEPDVVHLDFEFNLHPDYDLALLYLPQTEQSRRFKLHPLQIAMDLPDGIFELPIGVIGHPSFDSRFDPFPRLYGFGNEIGVKRFSPGRIRAMSERAWRLRNVEILLHDATTLSGSSGSCIVELETMTVLGLHFGGWPLAVRRPTLSNDNLLARLFEANGAVPLWRLHDDPLCQLLSFV